MSMHRDAGPPARPDTAGGADTTGGAVGWSRAQFLKRVGGGVGVALLGGAGYEGWRLATGGPPASRVQAFASRPDLQPPIVTVLQPATSTAPGHLFLAPSSGAGQRGVMILDGAGDVVWFRPTSPNTAMDFRPGLYRGQPVLTWWESLPQDELGQGEHVIVDASYRELARFPAGNHRRADLHELRLTPQGTALVTALETRRMDIRSAGGSRRGLVTGGVAQELEIPSARVLFEWRSLDHVAVTEAYNPIGYPWDYFHINAIDVDADGNLLISGRNTWTVYKVDRSSGAVIWRLGGKRSDFALGKGARFSYQHDARHHGDGSLVSVFDNGGAERTQIESQSRGLFLRLDFERMRATVERQYTHSPPVYGRVMGNAQQLPNGNVLVGWGADPHFTEFAADGTVRFDATLPYAGESYRAFRFPWRGRPLDRPTLVGQSHGSGVRLWASWNGATEVVAWRLDTGPAADRLRPDGRHPKSGFETPIDAPPRAVYAAAVALDRAGKPLATSRPIRLAV